MRYENSFILSLKTRWLEKSVIRVTQWVKSERKKNQDKI